MGACRQHDRQHHRTEWFVHIQVLTKARTWCPQPHRVFIGGNAGRGTGEVGVQPSGPQSEALWGWSGAFAPWQAASNPKQALQQQENQGLR